MQVSGRLLQHSNLRLTTPAGLSEFRDLCFRMMEAVIDLIDSATRIAYSAQHRAFKKLEGLLTEVPFGDTWLIRNDRGFKTHVVQQANGLRNAGKQLELRSGEWSINHARILVINERVDYTIAIEENGFHALKTINTSGC